MPIPYSTILLDLDGTLTDSSPGIINSIRYTLRKMGAPEPDDARLLDLIGPPMQDTLRLEFGFTGERHEQAVAAFREYFSETGIYENRLHDGVPELLSELKAAGATLAIATSKAAFFANRILEHFNIARFFDYCSGAELDGSRRAKPEVIAHALEMLGNPDHAATVMVGDREHDILGAREYGVASIGVLWGYGTRKELEHADAGAIVETMDQLRSSITAGFGPARPDA